MDSAHERSAHGPLAYEQAAAFARGETSAETLVGAALARAERVQRDCNAFVTLASVSAFERARDLDRRRAAGAALGPLAGVPIALKDNLCTEGLRTTAGSRALEQFVPPYSATVVARLEAAGAVVIAKTNLDEFGMGSSTEHSAFGATRNPWDRGRVAGGSSGGSAAAVAAGVVGIALGSDTGGSVRQPAAFTGVLGFKPTYGRLSRYGLVAYASSLDQVGVLCRSARDLALVMDASSGHDPQDATSLTQEPRFGAALAEGRLAGLRIGLIRELSGAGNSSEVLAALERAQAELSALGAVVAPVSLPSMPYGLPCYYLVATAEASSNLARYDGMIYSRRAGAGLGQGEAMRRSRGETFGPEVRRRILMGSYALSAGYYEAFYAKALRARRVIADELTRAFGEFDLLLSPTAPSVAYELGSKTEDPLEMYLGDVATVIANLSGVPALSLSAPGSSAEGLPCGLQFLAPALHDERLVAFAAALEDARGELAPLAPAYRSALPQNPSARESSARNPAHQNLADHISAVQKPHGQTSSDPTASAPTPPEPA